MTIQFIDKKGDEIAIFDSKECPCYAKGQKLWLDTDNYNKGIHDLYTIKEIEHFCSLSRIESHEELDHHSVVITIIPVAQK